MINWAIVALSFILGGVGSWICRGSPEMIMIAEGRTLAEARLCFWLTSVLFGAFLSGILCWIATVLH